MPADPVASARRARRRAIAPDPILTVSQWADEHRMLSTKASAEPGHWRTDRTPYLREPMDCLSASSPIARVVMMFGAQVGKTESGLNFLGYAIHHVPGPILAVQPTLDMAKRLSKQRLASMIEDTPVLRERISDPRSRDSGNTQLMKEFPGGVLILAGANSAAGLRSMPVRYLFLDEIDAYPMDVDEEGDPISLAEKRTTTFARRKLLLTSTPTTKDSSRIEREFERTGMRRYFVPCPHCGHMQWLRWRGVNDEPDDPRAKQYRLVWIDEARTRAGYVCADCGVIIEERHKTQMLAFGRWQATGPEDDITRGYHLSSLYSPVGWKSWVEVLREFEEASTDPTKLKTFVNTVLAETWEEAHTAKLDAEGLAKRAENYQLLTVPMGGLVVTAGIDVQDNRIEIVQRAWGVGEESWLVNHVVIQGDPSRTELWAQALDVLDMPLRHESGAELLTYAAAVDTGGHYTHEAYAWARQHKRRHVIAIKGASTPGKVPLGKPTKQDVNIRGQTVKKGVALWPVGTDTIKNVIHQRIRNITEGGSGAYHWPLGLVGDYWKQLTAERQVTRMVNGFAKRIWTKKDGDRNEALDCEVYAFAALQYVYTRHNRATFWEQMRRRLKMPTETAEASKTEAPATPEEPPPPDDPVPPRGPRRALANWKRR